MQLSIFSQRTHGVASLKNGAMEIMVHRKTARDDGRGVGEGLDDTSDVNTVFRMLLETPERSCTLLKKSALVHNYPIDYLVGRNDKEQAKVAELAIPVVRPLKSMFIAMFVFTNAHRSIP